MVIMQAVNLKYTRQYKLLPNSNKLMKPPTLEDKFAYSETPVNVESPYKKTLLY